jgi:uncharacterized protein (TIGR02147 family)
MLPGENKYMVNLFDYLDYRQYLRAVFEEKKRQLPGFSHRSLARKLSLKAPGHILFIIQGKRRLTEEISLRLSAYLKLNKKETDYLLSLVRYGEAKSPAEKQFAFEELLSARQRTAAKVPSHSYRFYEKWYVSAIRASLDVEPFKGDYGRLARSLCPPISASEAKEAIETLTNLQMAKKDENGFIRPAEPLICTGDSWQSATILNLQRKFLDLAKESFDRFSKDEFDVSNLTVTVSQETYDLIKRKIRDLRSQIMNMACAEQNPDRVLQVNFQLFPLQKKNRG